MLSNGVEETVESWLEGPFTGKLRVAWKMVPFAVSWSIWKERNGRIFEGKRGDTRDVFERAK